MAAKGKRRLNSAHSGCVLCIVISLQDSFLLYLWQDPQVETPAIPPIPPLADQSCVHPIQPHSFCPKHVPREEASPPQGPRSGASHSLAETASGLQLLHPSLTALLAQSDFLLFFAQLFCSPVSIPVSASQGTQPTPRAVQESQKERRGPRTGSLATI